MSSKFIKSFLLSLFISSSLMAQQARLAYPPTKKIKQEDNYHGTIIHDPYRWLENDTAADVNAWVQSENKLTNDYLSKIPYRQKIRDRLTEISNYEKYADPMKIGQYIFFSKNDGLQNQYVIYYQKGLDAAPQVFLDPNKMSNDGTAAVSIIGFSNNKKYCTYGINESGSDWQTIHVKEIDGAKDLKDELKYVKATSTAWYKDGFYYSRYPQPAKGTELSAKNEFQQVWYHRLGTPQSADQLVFEDRKIPTRYYQAQTTEDEHYLFIYKYQGTSGMEIIYKDLTKQDAGFKLLFKGFKNEYSIIDNYESSIFVSTNDGAPNNHVITLDLDLYDGTKPLSMQARVIVPEKKSLLENAVSTGGKLILIYLEDVSSHVYQYTYEGQLENEVQLPGIGTASGFGGYKDDREVYFSFMSFTYPNTLYRYHIDNHRVAEFKKSSVKFNPEDYTTAQVFYPGKDGTKIPMFLVYKKGLKKDGKNPTLLYGYGGFNVNLTPAFSASRLILLENGGIYALANIRGGGEYGEEWHKAGMLLKKQNVFDDFIAGGMYLVNEKYTSPDYLACQGGSNGGLLIGAVINQRPELFKVAFPAVGVMDMLRYHRFTVGWGWATEFGSSDSLPYFNNLIKYSPLHNITNRTYPATLVTTADHDDRVVPAHSFKYIATLQEKQLGNNPVLIRVDTKAGHGAGKPLTKALDEVGDIYSFMFYNMNVPVKY